jgi:hypothetical protein
MTSRHLAPFVAAAGVAAALLLAPAASATPQCTTTGPRTTQCSTNGSTQIVTSPPETNVNPYWGGWGFGWGGLVINFG